VFSYYQLTGYTNEKKANQQCPIPTGKLIIIGGAEDKAKKRVKREIDKMVLKEFTSLCGNNSTIDLLPLAVMKV
jgi:hypothetical protein